MSRLNDSPRKNVAILAKERLDFLTGYPVFEVLVSVAIVPIEILRVWNEIS